MSSHPRDTRRELSDTGVESALLTPFSGSPVKRARRRRRIRRRPLPEKGPPREDAEEALRAGQGRPASERRA